MDEPAHLICVFLHDVGCATVVGWICIGIVAWILKTGNNEERFRIYFLFVLT
jgi:hypothetical protein